MKVCRIDHINMAVRDLDESVQFYERVFGFMQLLMKKAQHTWPCMRQMPT